MAWWLVAGVPSRVLTSWSLPPSPPPLLPQSNFAQPPPAPAAPLPAAAGSLFDVLAHFHPPANRICSNILMKHTTCLTDILDSDQTFEETSSQTLVSHSDKLYFVLPSIKRTHSNLYSVGSWHFVSNIYLTVFWWNAASKLSVYRYIRICLGKMYRKKFEKVLGILGDFWCSKI